MSLWTKSKNSPKPSLRPCCIIAWTRCCRLLGAVSLLAACSTVCSVMIPFATRCFARSSGCKLDLQMSSKWRQSVVWATGSTLCNAILYCCCGATPPLTGGRGSGGTKHCDACIATNQLVCLYAFWATTATCFGYTCMLLNKVCNSYLDASIHQLHVCS